MKTLPEELYKKYLAISDNKWQDDTLYLSYREEAAKYLGPLEKDALERDRLVIALNTKRAADPLNRKKEYEDVVDTSVGKIENLDCVTENTSSMVSLDQRSIPKAPRPSDVSRESRGTEKLDKE
jgi:hypothetical protein